MMFFFSKSKFISKDQDLNIPGAPVGLAVVVTEGEKTTYSAKS